MILSILIPTLPERAEKFNKLFFDINFQIEMQNAFEIVEVLIDEAPKGKSIGEKRNQLLQKASGEYVCFIDDDDKLSNDYIRLILKALQSKPDCLSLKGVITFDGQVWHEHTFYVYLPHVVSNKASKLMISVK